MTRLPSPFRLADPRGVTLAACLGLAGPAIAAVDSGPAAADPAAALEALLGTEVEGASRRIEKTLDAPAIVSVLGQAESGALAHTTVGDMLARLPGTYLTTGRSYVGVGVRGFNRPGDFNARLLMAIDGYRVNDVLYDQALPEFEFPIVADWVKRLEMVSGPASSVYGGNALLGVVNAVTLDGADVPGLGLRVTSQGSGSHGLTATYGRAAGGSDLFVGVAAHRLAGETLTLPELTSPDLPGGVVAGLDGTRYGSLMAKWRRGPWRLTAVSQARLKDVAVAIFGTVPGVPGTRYTDRYAYGELAYDGAWEDDWRRQLRLSVSRSRFAGDYVFEEASVGRYLNRDTARASWIGVDTRLHWRGWLNHAPVFGVELRRALEGAQANRDLDPAATYLDRNDRPWTAGAYVQDQIRLSPATALTLGLRSDRMSDQATQWSPRLAVVHRAVGNESIKFMLGRAFRAPNLYERFYEDGGISQVAHPGLQPERVRTVELSWERALGPDARLALSAYRYRITDLIDFVTLADGVGRYDNVSGASTTGVDLELEQRRPSGWHWRSSLSLLRARSDGAALTNSPRWLFKGHALGPLGPGWSAGLQWTAMARREGLRGPVPAFLTGDAIVRATVASGQTVALVVRNLADRRTYDPASSENALLRVPRERRMAALEWRGEF